MWLASCAAWVMAGALVVGFGAPTTSQLPPRPAGTTATVLACLHAEFRPPKLPGAAFQPPTAFGPPFPTSASSNSAYAAPSEQLPHAIVRPPYATLQPLCGGLPPFCAPPASLPALSVPPFPPQSAFLPLQLPARLLQLLCSLLMPLQPMFLRHYPQNCLHHQSPFPLWEFNQTAQPILTSLTTLSPHIWRHLLRRTEKWDLCILGVTRC